MNPNEVGAEVQHLHGTLHGAWICALLHQPQVHREVARKTEAHPQTEPAEAPRRGRFVMTRTSSPGRSGSAIDQAVTKENTKMKMKIAAPSPETVEGTPDSRQPKPHQPRGRCRESISPSLRLSQDFSSACGAEEDAEYRPRPQAARPRLHPRASGFGHAPRDLPSSSS